MKIRSRNYSSLQEMKPTVVEFGGIEILADDNRPLFTIDQNADGSIRIDAGYVCRHQGKLLNDRLIIHPVACNAVVIEKPEYHG